MDYTTEQTDADLAGNFARRIFAKEIHKFVTYSGAVQMCGNCGSAWDGLTLVPHFDYLGCDSCMVQNPNNGKPLCAGCDQFRCDGCGETFGADHRVRIADETDQPLHCCEACAYESKPRCPCCDEHAHMRVRENDIERWYECEACGAKLDEAEITAANQEPIPAYLVRHELVRQATTMAELMEVVRVHEASGCPCAAMNEVLMPVPAQRETRTATPRLVA